ncbi:hypothetical protein SSX86_013899 [Deinandra increscens subsp. villosa]|uniref:C2H2-type domain-containing protein n=1 Tax=Deinandra increscens subsp. villosa TaxID=3103831 RepID=A0AAP0D2H5_9ASTR
MSKLIQETDQEPMSHICVLCDKSFPSGRSLGGHMRSHVINSTDHHDHHTHHDHQMKKKKKQMKKLSSVNNGDDLGYELRKDPKKTPKVKDSSEVEMNMNSNCLVVLDKLCKECGKGFQSWKALFGHMKCHSEKVSKNYMNNQDSLTSHSENQNSGAKFKKSRSKRYTATATTVTVTTTTTITTASSSISMNANNNNSNHASTSILSEIEQDQESEVAMCLMMLSRDEGKWGNEIESSDHCNYSTFVRVEGKEPTGTGDGSEIKKIAENQISVDYLGRSELGSAGLEKFVIQNDEFDEKLEFGKRKFECITCNKSFHSYQALGGHKASHKKLKESLDSKPFLDHEHIINGFIAKPSENDPPTKRFNLGAGSSKKTVVLGVHECPICLKIFSSGQALGGHKRSHMIAEAKLNQQTSMNLIEKVNEPVRETRGFIDLNMLPSDDTMEEDMMIMKPWHWVDTTNHESTTLLGLLSTS